MQRIKNYIDGELCEPETGKWLDNVDPSVGAVYAEIPDSNEKDVDRAVKAAEKAFPGWAGTSVEKRSEYIGKISAEIKNQLVDLAKAESRDNGKPVSLALAVDIPRAVSNFKFYADAITQYASEAHESIG